MILGTKPQWHWRCCVSCHDEASSALLVSPGASLLRSVLLSLSCLSPPSTRAFIRTVFLSLITQWFLLPSGGFSSGSGLCSRWWLKKTSKQSPPLLSAGCPLGNKSVTSSSRLPAFSAGITWCYRMATNFKCLKLQRGLWNPLCDYCVLFKKEHILELPSVISMFWPKLLCWFGLFGTRWTWYKTRLESTQRHLAEQMINSCAVLLWRPFFMLYQIVVYL